MARPVKNNADYFPHDANMRNDRRVQAVRKKFGLEGYAVYTMLKELICDSEGLVLVVDDIELELVSGDFGIESELLEDMINYFKKLDLITVSNDTEITCNDLNYSLKPMIEKRELMRNKRSVKRVCDTQTNVSVNKTTTNKVCDTQSTQSKVKESKVEKSKVKDISIRMENFKKQVFEFSPKYPVETLKPFFNYWSEPNRSNKKMLFEMKDTWHLERRIQTWFNNSWKKQNNGSAKKTQPEFSKKKMPTGSVKSN